MATAEKAPSFQEVIQNARIRRKNQALADKLLGKSARRSSTPASASLSARASPAPNSLASRVGIGKRSASASNLNRRGRNVAPAPSTISRPTKMDRISTSIASNKGDTAVRGSRSAFNIKGSASAKFILIGSNFAPGTTAADIESAMEPVGGPMVQCTILTTHPAVVAEMVYSDKRSADKVIATFDKQKADGRTIHIEMKPGGSTQIPTGPRSQSDRSSAIAPQSTFDDLRERADRERREMRRAEPEVQDGRYGFADRLQMKINQDLYGRSRSDRTWSANGSYRSGGGANNESAGLYSDRMIVDDTPRARHER
ncbi:hypothetical protein AJ80_08510 [Polytolypa hystricis UAMH7299]|uniref:RRM domain-containing protein n=1 Tax=Polytolypa hystricis (strain UAMH7299) TaxID=1447883 RepID=A0A2B7X6V0_POLH7|nr:hypothetical protein AJ80_08510 [Polytolypa hystricis UAMH7299]